MTNAHLVVWEKLDDGTVHARGAGYYGDRDSAVAAAIGLLGGEPDGGITRQAFARDLCATLDVQAIHRGPTLVHIWMRPDDVTEGEFRAWCDERDWNPGREGRS